MADKSKWVVEGDQILCPAGGGPTPSRNDGWDITGTTTRGGTLYRIFKKIHPDGRNPKFLESEVK